MFNFKIKLITVENFSIIFFIFLFQVLFLNKIPQFFPDTRDYVNFANDIGSLKLFSSYSDSVVPIYRAIRTPIYPLVIFLVLLFSPDLGTGITYFNLLIGSLVILLTFKILKNVSLSFGISTVYVLALFYLPVEFFSILTEWFSYNLLFLLLILILEKNLNGHFRVSIISAIAVILILTRPAFLPLLLIILYFLQAKYFTFLKSGLFILPFFIWCFFNYFTIGHFGLTAFSGFNLFGVGSIIGKINVQESDSTEARGFANYFNTHPQVILSNGDTLEKKYFQQEYDRNLYKIALPFFSNQYSGVRINEILGSYGKRAIWENYYNYFHFLDIGIKRIISLVEQYLLIICGIAILLIKGPRNYLRTAYINSLYSYLLLFLVYILLCISVQILVERYFLVFFMPILIISTGFFLSQLMEIIFNFKSSNNDRIL